MPPTTTATGTQTPNTTAAQPGRSAANPAGGSTGDPVTTTEQVSVVSLDADGLKGQTPATARLKNGGYAMAWVSVGQGLCTRTYTANATPAGAPTCLATGTTASIQKPAIAGLVGGGYVVAFVTEELTSSLNLQRFDDAGKTMGLGQLVSNGSPNKDTEATVAVLECGDFVVGWTSTQGQPFNVSDIHARRYQADGVAVSAAQQVNTFVGGPTTGTRRFGSAVTALRDGGYVFVWTSEGQTTNGSELYTQRFNADGVPVGLETLVSTRVDSFVGNTSSIAGLAGGGYVITWNFNSTVIAQRFTVGGAQAGAAAAAAVDPLAPVDPTVLCDRGTKNPPGPCLTFQIGGVPAALDDGGYVIAYFFSGPPKANEQGIYLRRFAADGAATAPSQRISNTSNAGLATASPAGMGGFAIAWQAFAPVATSQPVASRPGELPPGIYARAFDSRGL
ncbi:hypothetical protein [Polaromonas sp. CG_9.11]|uniref:hypothetical protein n=1 Tax=Polaromonas sp. CG_9.11 TaxID=2787730 RepID=UPI0018CBA583|nr:hypothetical protein [Polaromonas sp. CG_9.11]MBG6076747.1 hypothetical protein [Polaromonas sp. CG_9.11]